MSTCKRQSAQWWECQHFQFYHSARLTLTLLVFLLFLLCFSGSKVPPHLHLSWEGKVWRNSAGPHCSPFDVYLYGPAGAQQTPWALCAIFSLETRDIPSSLRRNDLDPRLEELKVNGKSQSSVALAVRFCPFLGNLFWFSFPYDHCWDRSKPKQCKRTPQKVLS